MDKLYSLPRTEKQGDELIQTAHSLAFDPKTMHIDDAIIELPPTYDTITPEGSQRTTAQKLAFCADQLIQAYEQGAALGGMLVMQSLDGKTTSGRRVVLSIDGVATGTPTVIANPDYPSALRQARENR